LGTIIDTFHIDIDLVLQNTVTGELYVLDTKYKSPEKPSQDDINQIVAYATAKNCRNAVLIYPTSLVKPLNILMGKIRVRSMTFALDGDLEQAGQTFLQDLFHSV
jgi:5-methylcytosine-specific restriction enzyme subunit McrC